MKQGLEPSSFTDRRSRKRVAAAVALAVIGALGAAAPAYVQTFGLADYSGEEVYLTFCGSCHGPEGRGNGPVASTLNVLVPDLTRLSERNDGRFPGLEVLETIDGRAPIVAHGPRTMPVWGYEFWIEEGADIAAEATARDVIERLVEHLRSIQRGAPGLDEPP
jgi:mono/diheme cytochrome c family protein